MGEDVERGEKKMEKRRGGGRKGGWEEGGRGAESTAAPGPGSGVHGAGGALPSRIPSITPSSNHPGPRANPAKPVTPSPGPFPP